MSLLSQGSAVGSGVTCSSPWNRKGMVSRRAGGNGTAGTAMAVPVFEGEKMASLGF